MREEIIPWLVLPGELPEAGLPVRIVVSYEFAPGKRDEAVLLYNIFMESPRVARWREYREEKPGTHPFKDEQPKPSTWWTRLVGSIGSIFG